MKESVGLENTLDKQVVQDAMNNLMCIMDTNTWDLDNENEEFSPATLSPLRGILPGEYKETMDDTGADASATIKQETSVPIGINSPRGFKEPRPDDSV